MWYPLRPRTQKRHQQIVWIPVRAPVAAVEFDALSLARSISEDICAGCWSKCLIDCKKQVHKPLINHNLVGICIVAFNTASLTVGTWISARTFYLALPASDAPATMSAVNIFLKWQIPHAFEVRFGLYGSACACSAIGPECVRGYARVLAHQQNRSGSIVGGGEKPRDDHGRLLLLLLLYRDFSVVVESDPTPTPRTIFPQPPVHDITPNPLKHFPTTSEGKISKIGIIGTSPGSLSFFVYDGNFSEAIGDKVAVLLYIPRRQRRAMDSCAKQYLFRALLLLPS